MLKPGARFCSYDVMRMNSDPIAFPVPWAQTIHTSFLRTPDETKAALTEAGFEVIAITDRSEFAKNFFKARIAVLESGAPPNPAAQVSVMKGTAKLKLQNVMANIERHCIAPVEICARKNSQRRTLNY